MNKNEYKYFLIGNPNEPGRYLKDAFEDGISIEEFHTDLNGMLKKCKPYEIVQDNIEDFDLAQTMKDFSKGKINDMANPMVYLIKIPKEYFGDVMISPGNYSCPIPLLKTGRDVDSGKLVKKIANNFIQGVYNRKTGRFETNPNFTPIFDPSGCQYSKKQFDLISKRLNDDPFKKMAEKRKNCLYDEIFEKDKRNDFWKDIMETYAQQFDAKLVQNVKVDTTSYDQALDNADSKTF